HRKEHMDAAKRVLRYLCSTSGMGLVLGGRARVVLTGHVDASWVDDLATQRSSQGYTFSLGSGSVSWRSTRSSSVLSSKQPRSPPVLYVDNKAMLALCQEHRTKHIALRYFLARELQQRGQLCLAYVTTQANTADIFTKALQPCAYYARMCGDVVIHPELALPFLTDLVTSSDRDLTSGFRGNRAFATPADEGDWDEQHMEGTSEEAGPLPYCSVDIPMDDDNPRESVNAKVYYDFANNGYVTPQPVDTNVSERIGPNFLPDPKAGDEATYPEDANLLRYT
ncbi:unnamed protein product, partial [Closterium sp. NIES-53]